MYYKIGMHIEESKITAVLCTKNTIWESLSLENFSNIFNAIESVLTDLLNKSGVSPGRITYLNIAIDFSELIKKGMLPCAKVGYLQLGTKTIDNILSEEDFDPEFKKLIVTSKVSEANNTNNIFSTLKYFQESGVEIVVINTMLSLDNIEEKELIKKINNFCEGKFKVMTSEALTDLGLIKKGNTLLYNGLLIKGTEKFFAELSDICNSLSLYCNKYCLTINGTLISQNRAIILPVKTINSTAISWLVGIGSLEQIKNCLIIKKENSHIYITSIRNGVPKSSPFSYIKGNLKLNLSHPDILEISVTSGGINSAVKEDVFNALKRINLQDEFLPVILAGIEYEEFPELFYSSVVFPVNSIFEEIAGAYGAASALLEIESNKKLVYKDKKVKEVENLWRTLYSRAEQEGMDLEQEVYKYFKETPLRYLPKEISLIQAVLYGHLKTCPSLFTNKSS
ncbi:MAG: hypothetical protein PWQ67_1007 [Clostridia bacterium]|jgi:hypothetical protein|nr:hypothetical protein [Clostridia bacterium]